MSRRLIRALPALVLAAAATACSAERTAAPDGSAAGRFSFGDATGDTLASTSPTTVQAIDATRIAGTVSDDEVELSLTFRQPVAPWSAGAANSLDGYVDFDLDEDARTGIPSAIDEEQLGGAGIGSDYFISLRDDGAGGVDLVQAATNGYVRVPATFSGSTVTIRVPRALLAGDDGNFAMAALIGNADRPTDLLPNAGHYVIRR